MTAKVLVKDLFDLGLWSKYCNEYGVNPYAVNEGLLSGDDYVEVNIDGFTLLPKEELSNQEDECQI